jgi:demethylmenaquinone methyltransferase/2-methoxy-6-polyprenyl-1,4-benzoquinol methylase
MPDPDLVRGMFSRIAGRYDLLNRVLSAGIDQRWRRRTVRLAGDVRGRLVIDACCGTGDLALAFERAGARVLGLDFTPAMLERAHAKGARRARRASFAVGDALALPLPDACADVLCIGFGLRNLADRGQGLREFRRVLRPGGLLLVLEFSMPPGALLGPLYRAYFTRWLPAIGRAVSRDTQAYDYLPRTVLAWPKPAELERELRAAGLVECGHESLTRGIACLHYARAGRVRAA